TVLALDVSRPETFERFAGMLSQPVDVLINNAGIVEHDPSVSSVTTDGMERVLRTNVVGPALLTKALLPMLRRGRRKVVVNMSSSLGSLRLTPGGMSYAYDISKAALNMLTVLLHKEISGEGFTVISLDPGWNRTDMGGGAAPLDPVDTVGGMIAVLERLPASESGKF